MLSNFTSCTIASHGSYFNCDMRNLCDPLLIPSILDQVSEGTDQYQGHYITKTLP